MGSLDAYAGAPLRGKTHVLMYWPPGCRVHNEHLAEQTKRCRNRPDFAWQTPFNWKAWARQRQSRKSKCQYVDIDCSCALSSTTPTPRIGDHESCTVLRWSRNSAA
jgi:hypothetical protein